MNFNFMLLLSKSLINYHLIITFNIIILFNFNIATNPSFDYRTWVNHQL